MLLLRPRGFCVLQQSGKVEVGSWEVVRGRRLLWPPLGLPPPHLNSPPIS